MATSFLYECKLCSFSIKHFNLFENHLLTLHNLNPEQAYTDFVLHGIEKFCECGCKQKTLLKWKSGYSKFVKGHNARVKSAFSNKCIIEKSIAKRKEGYESGRIVAWNKGLTKESDLRINDISKKISNTIKSAYGSGEMIAWQTGLSKETDDRIMRASQTKIEKYESGQTKSWNAGLTKETNNKLLETSRKISEKYKEREAGKRLNIDIVKERVNNAGFDVVLNDDNSDGYTFRKEKCLIVECRICKSQLHKSLYSLEGSPRCDTCHPKESSGQIDIFKFIESIGVKSTISNRKRK